MANKKTWKFIASFALYAFLAAKIKEGQFPIWFKPSLITIHLCWRTGIGPSLSLRVAGRSEYGHR